MRLCNNLHTHTHAPSFSSLPLVSLAYFETWQWVAETFGEINWGCSVPLGWQTRQLGQTESKQNPVHVSSVCLRITGLLHGCKSYCLLLGIVWVLFYCVRVCSSYLCLMEPLGMGPHERLNLWFYWFLGFTDLLVVHKDPQLCLHIEYVVIFRLVHNKCCVVELVFRDSGKNNQIAPSGLIMAEISYCSKKLYYNWKWYISCTWSCSVDFLTGLMVVDWGFVFGQIVLYLPVFLE